MTTLFERHCSDESLIAHLDGELPFYRREIVRRHVEKCWRCRLRLSEIEEQVLETARAMERDSFPGPGRVAAARLRFLDRADAVAEGVFRARLRPAAARPALAWTAAGVAILGLFAAWRLTREEAAPVSARETIQRIETAVGASAQAPAHQRFRVVVRQLRPEPASRERVLELWSEPERGRYTTRLSDSGGTLRHALWQPSPDRQYVYSAAGAAQVVAITRRQAREGWNEILFRDGLTLEDLEAGLLTWLENRPWRPISLSSGAALLADAGGGALSVEEMPAGLRLRAARTSGGVSVEFVLEVDRRTYVPRLQFIRYESAGRSLELRLSSEPAGTTAASFEPPRMLSKAPAPLLASPTPRLHPAAPDAFFFEVEIYHALHRVRACLGETIEVARGAGGSFQVRGAVGSAERKEQVLTALAPLGGPRLFVSLKSASEMLNEIGPASVTLAQPPAAAGPSGRRRRIKALAAHFGASEAAAEEFAERALSAGEDLMRDAQALRLLAERFGGREAFASPGAYRMLTAMSCDHLTGLESKLRTAAELLRPVVGPIEARVAAAPGSGSRWDTELLSIFQQCNGLNERLRRLLTGDDDGARPGLVREIAEAIPSLQSSLQIASSRALAAGGAAPQH